MRLQTTFALLAIALSAGCGGDSPPAPFTVSPPAAFRASVIPASYSSVRSNPDVAAVLADLDLMGLFDPGSFSATGANDPADVTGQWASGASRVVAASGFPLAVVGDVSFPEDYSWSAEGQDLRIGHPDFDGVFSVEGNSGTTVALTGFFISEDLDTVWLLTVSERVGDFLLGQSLLVRGSDYILSEWTDTNGARP
jgi:hypothetical protein